MRDLDVIQCNAKLRNYSVVGKTLKDSFIRLGMVCVRSKEEVQKNIEDMEARDNEGLAVRKTDKGNLK